MWSGEYPRNTTSRAGRQLVRSGGGGVRVTCTPEDPKVVVARRGTEESAVRSGSRRSSGRKAVEQVGGGVEALSPEAHDVVRRANHPLSLAVLRGIRTRHTQLEMATGTNPAGITNPNPHPPG